MNKDKISFDEYEKKICDILTYSQNIQIENTHELLSNWYINKKFFIDAFDGTIYQVPHEITFTITDEQKKSILLNFLEWVDKSYNNEQLTNFLLFQSQSLEDFYNNKVCSRAILPDGRAINPGMKIGKSCKYFLKDKKDIEKVQNKLSEVINSKQISGYLCLSVDPLDFLSVSDNDAGWTSCHSLQGSSRSGNLSLMQDNSTFICYIKSKEDTNILNFPPHVLWNSKKWRTFLFLSEDKNTIFTGKSYPFAEYNILDFVNKNVFPKAGFGEWSYWNFINYTKENRKFVFEENWYELDKAINLQSDLPYCDLLKNNYNPKYCYKKKKIGYGKPQKMKFPRINFGYKNTKCIRCGNQMIGIGATMMCTPCELKYGTEIYPDYIEQCDICQKRILSDESFMVQGDCLCAECYESVGDECADCEEYYYNEDLIYDINTKKFYCKDCAKKRGIN